MLSPLPAVHEITCSQMLPSLLPSSVYSPPLLVLVRFYASTAVYALVVNQEPNNAVCGFSADGCMVHAFSCLRYVTVDAWSWRDR